MKKSLNQIDNAASHCMCGGLRSKGYFKKSFNDKPLVSVITVVFNGKEHLEQTIKSVINQTYDNVEYIIIDGGSDDGTIEIIKKYESSISRWISEPDNGIADAFNKGISLASGDYVQLVNSDDWLSENQIEVALTNLEKSLCGFAFGNGMYHDANSRPLFLYKGDPDYPKVIRRGMPAVNHPTVLARKEMYDKIGSFNTKYKIAMDYDWLLRSYLAGFKGLYISELTGHMRLCGVSENRYAQGYKEVMVISVENGLSRPYGFLLYMYRVLKTKIRLALEKFFPTKRIVYLRKIVKHNLK